MEGQIWSSKHICHSLSQLIKGRISAATKSRDRQLAKQQALLLDAVGPLAYILEETAKGELTQKAAREAAQTALKLLGNASMHVSRERRKLTLQNLNAGLIDMERMTTSLPLQHQPFLENAFCKKAKEEL